MTDINTSAEAVERLAYYLDFDAPHKQHIEALGAAALRALAAERDRLRQALYPFAEAVDSLDEDHPDHYAISKSPAAMGINGGDLRKARAALKETGHD